MGEGSKREQCYFFSSQLPFSHLDHYPQENWALLLILLVGGFVYILEPFGSLQCTLLWGWEFLPLPQPPHIFLVRGFEALFPCKGALGCVVCLMCQLFLLDYPHANVGPPTPPAATLPSPVLQQPPCLESSPPGCPSLPLLPVWMNVSSSTPWFQMSTQFDFLAVLVFFVFKFVVLLLVVVQGGTVYLPTPLSWPEVPVFLIITSILLCVICLVRFSESSWFNFGRLHVSKNLSISSRLSCLLTFSF